MPITHFKQFRGGGYPSPRKVTRVPYEIYTLEEADERGIEPVEHWREKIFYQGEDLTGKYVLTDDDPPLVTPIVSILTNKGVDKQGKIIWKVHFPWTWTKSAVMKIQYGVKGHVRTEVVRQKFNNTSRNSFRIFFLLVVLRADPKKVVECIWSVKQEREQEYLLRLLMESEQAQSAVSELARDIFRDAGASPEELAKEMVKLATDPKAPPTVRKDMLLNIADRIVLDDRKPEVQATGFLGVGVAGAITGSAAPEQIAASVQHEFDQQAGDNGKIRKLIPQSVETLDE